MTPIRIQRSRQRKQVSPNGLPIKYVGRPTKWGNPYRVKGEPDNWFVVEGEEPLATFNQKEDAIDCCLELFREYIVREHKRGKLNIEDLRGYNLSCWCPLDEPCHVDVLFELLNQKA